jgi:hypothetical protein
MPEPASDNGGGATPEGSQPSNQTPGTGDQPQVPFHKDPAMQDFLGKQEEYMRRQIDGLTAEMRERMNQSLQGNTQGQVPTQPAPSPDEVENIVNDMASRYDVDKRLLRDLTQRYDNLAQKKAESRVKNVEQELEGVKIQMRLAAMFSDTTKPDASQLMPKMLEVFKGLNEVDRHHVLYSERGPDSLYSWAKRSAGQGVVSQQARQSATSTATRGMTSDQKMSGQSAELNRASSALQSGNREEYDRIMKNYKQ